MSKPLFSNNAAVFLTDGLLASAASLTLPAGVGSRFPNPTNGDWFLLTIENLLLGRREIVKVTSRNGDILAITRGQEGTAIQTFPGDNTVAAHRLTAGQLTVFAAAGAAAASDATPLVNGEATPGVAPALSRADHVHPIDHSRASADAVPAPGSTIPKMDGVPAIGELPAFARADHVHPTDASRAPLSAIPLPATTLPKVNGPPAVGALTSYARADHVHPIDASRAPVDSPVFTGLPKAPTAAPGTDTDQLATLRYVNSMIGSGGTVTATGGTATRTIAAHFGDFLNVKDFGAKGNGVEDDTAAIQAAINATSPTIGGVVLFPPGRYLVSSTLTVNNPNVTIMGASMWGVQILVNTHTFDLFVLAPAGGQVHIRDIWLNFFAAPTGASPRWAINAKSVNRVYLTNIMCTGAHSFCVSAGAEFRSDRCFIYTLAPTFGTGYQFSGAAEVRDVMNGYIQNATNAGTDARAGILVQGGSAVSILNMELIAMTNPLWVKPPAGVNVFSLRVADSWCDTSTGTAVILDGTAGQILRANISNSWMATCAAGLYVQGVVKGLSVVNCDVFGNKSSGIDLAGGAIVTGSMFTANKIAGNGIISGGSGITVGAGVSGFAIQDNVIGPAADFGPNTAGIYIAPGASNDYIITGNRLRGNSVAGLLDNGTGANKVVANNLT